MVDAKKILTILIRAKDETAKGFKSASKNAEGMGKFAAVGAAGASITAVGVAGAIALNKAADSAAAYGGQVTTLQRLTGASAEESSKWAAILGRFGVEGKVAGGIIKKLSGEIVGHSSALKAAGIATQNSDGSNRSSQAVLADLAEYYSKAKDKTAAVALASKVLGRNYMSLLPVLAGGKASIDKISESAKKNGLILSQDQVDACKKYGAAVKDNAQAQQGLQVQLGLTILPLKTLAENYLAKVFKWINGLNPETKKWVTGLAIGVTVLALVVGPLLTIIGLLPLMAGGLGIVAGAASATWIAITGPIGLVIAAIALVAGAVYLIWKNWGKIGPWFARLWKGITTACGTALDRVVGFLKSLPGRALDALKDLAAFISRPVKDALEWLGKLNPFMRHSPSLVDNVLSGVGVIANAYSSLSGMTVDAPRIGALAMPGVAYGSSGGSSSAMAAEASRPIIVPVYLDGREISRGLGNTAAHSSRSGVR